MLFWGSASGTIFALRSAMTKTRAWCWLPVLAALPCVVACGGRSFNGGADVSGGAPGAGAANGGSSGADAANAGSTNAGGNGGSGGADNEACTSNTDCELIERGCCSCGLGPISNYAAINRLHSEAFRREQCQSDVACGPCPPIAPGFDNPVNYYIATCAAGRCTAVDLHETSLTDCVTKDDCQARSGTSCCDSCNAPTLAINQAAESELNALVCGSGQSACQTCQIHPPAGVGQLPSCDGGKCGLTGGCNLCPSE